MTNVTNKNIKTEIISEIRVHSRIGVELNEEDKTISEKLVNEDLDLDTEIELDDLPV